MSSNSVTLDDGRQYHFDSDGNRDTSDEYETEESAIGSSDGDDDQETLEEDKCWRCRILGEVCDNDEDCVYCFDDRTLDPDRQNWQYDCKRGPLATELEAAFSGVSELHYGIWRFEDSSLDKVLIVTISYGDLSIDELWGDTIRRPIMPTDRLMTYQEFMLSMKIFLQQFATLSSRWGRMYEPITEQIIMDAATFQVFWFTRANLIPTDLLDESTLIAAALYCLVLTNDMSQVTGNWRWRLTLSNPAITYEHMADVEKDPNKGTSPAVDIWKFSGREAQPLKAGPPHKRTFASVLRVILQSAQRILYRGRAEDEPYLFYILCILFLVYKDIKDCADWTGAMDEGAEVLEDSLRKFCHMFHLSSGNIHPLSPDFDDEAYASMADGNGFAAEHYRELHQLWEDNKYGDETEEDAEDLWHNLGIFVMGMIY